MRLRVGLLVNPIAGIGGPTGDKGSDGHWQAALAAGAEPQAQQRAMRLVEATTDVEWLTLPGVMGVPGLPTLPGEPARLGKTSAKDTAAGARALAAAGVELLCFVGGDGTATDIAAAIGGSVPCLGIPGGVKVTSSVFAHDIPEAAWLLSHLASGFETIARDVTDLDEEAYREGRLDTRLTGSLLVPMSPVIQGGKDATVAETPLDGIVEHAMVDWDPDALTFIGAGSVCRALKQRFWGEPTLLGVDAVQGDRIVATDLDAAGIEALAEGQDAPVRLVLSLVGGQGVLFGRGTQVLAPTVLRRIGWEGIKVIAPPEKLLGLRGVTIDTGDPALDAEAPKFLRVISGYNETRMVRVNPPPKDSS